MDTIDKTINKGNLEKNSDPTKRGGRVKGSKNKVTTAIRDMAQPYGARAIRKLVGLLKSTNEAIVLQASKELIDRGYGKAHQSASQTVDTTIRLEVTDMELARRAAFLLTKAELALDRADTIDNTTKPLH